MDQKFIAPPKGRLFEKIIDSENVLQKLFPEKSFSVEKRKVGNRSKRILPKFHADPSFVCGVNSRPKFRYLEYHLDYHLRNALRSNAERRRSNAERRRFVSCRR